MLHYFILFIGFDRCSRSLSHILMFNNLTDLAFYEGLAIDLDWVGLWRILQKNSPCFKIMTFFELTLLYL
jgi:hypothetical protein